MRMALAAVLMWSACGEGTSWPTIAGWHGDPRYWRAENDEIIGSTDGVPPITQNTFLTGLSSYADFVLDLEFKIRNGNSGIQVRSEELPDYVVRGYQADVS